jgi:hypothetical protein
VKGQDQQSRSSPPARKLPFIAIDLREYHCSPEPALRGNRKIECRATRMLFRAERPKFIALRDVAR